MMGACCGSGTAGILYHRRVQTSALFSVKASAGGDLAGMAVLAGVSSQMRLKWMTYPDVLILISLAGSLVFPWAVFSTMQKAYLKQSHNK